jgi:intracellular sulfur oxidation DsrE/DsrF family protein
VKRNRFIALDGAVKTVNRELEAKARDLAGLKGYVTNLAACPDRQLPRTLEHREVVSHVEVRPAGQAGLSP